VSGEKWIEIAVVGRAHGIRGEVNVAPHNEASEQFEPGVIVRWSKGKAMRDLEIEQVRQGKALLVGFVDVYDRDGAIALTGGTLRVRRSSLPDPDDGEFYLSDVLGAVVFDHDSGDRLGVVARLGETSVDVLEIKLDGGGEVLVPILERYITSIGQRDGEVVVRDIHHWIAE